MPAAVADNMTEEKPDHTEQRWKILKAHIMRERARKKQEREQEVEEERLRKEREAREQQDVMTLGETREQISHLEIKLTQLKEEKHQLFLQLKKVLNEDDNRRRQLVKENAEQMIPIQALPANMVHQQLYIQQHQHQQQNQQQPQPPPQQPRPTLQPQPQQPPPQPSNYKALAGKRPRSPSPPLPQVPVSLYHGYGYKPASQVGNYQPGPQKDDGRRNELVRAVLWNKTPQYGATGQPSAFYPVGPVPQDLPIYYTLARESPSSTRGAPQNTHESASLPQVDFHLEPTKLVAAEHYAALRGGPPFHSHVIHPSQIQNTIGGPQMAQSKGGNISAGYPVRSQPQYQPPTSTLYTPQTRPPYGPTRPISYPPRD